MGTAASCIINDRPPESFSHITYLQTIIYLYIRYYIDRIVSSIEGMKVLLLDADTIQIVSTVYSQVGSCYIAPFIRREREKGIDRSIDFA